MQEDMLASFMAASIPEILVVAVGIPPALAPAAPVVGQPVVAPLVVSLVPATVVAIPAEIAAPTHRITVSNRWSENTFLQGNSTSDSSGAKHGREQNMNNEEFKKLVESVRKNPSLLHALAFEPKKAARETDFIAKTDRTILAGMQAENLIGHALGMLELDCGTTCEVSCGGPTCCGPNELSRFDMEFMMSGFSRPIPSATSGAANGMERINPASARFAVSFYNRIIPGGMNVTCGPDYTCCCTSGTCGGVTCGGSTCDVTCSGDSCGNTCGDSCGYTTNITFDPLSRERQLAQLTNQPLLWK